MGRMPDPPFPPPSAGGDDVSGFGFFDVVKGLSLPEIGVVRPGVERERDGDGNLDLNLDLDLEGGGLSKTSSDNVRLRQNDFLGFFWEDGLGSTGGVDDDAGTGAAVAEGKDTEFLD